MITLTAIIRQLQEEKEALDATVAALEQLARKQNGASSKPNAAAAASSKTVVARGRDLKAVSPSRCPNAAGRALQRHEGTLSTPPRRKGTSKAEGNEESQ